MTMDIKWFEKSGKEGDVVISSRIRLARNLQKIPFPIRMNEQQKRQVRDNIVHAAKQSTNATLRNLIYIDMEQVDKVGADQVVLYHRYSFNFIYLFHIYINQIA